MRRLRHQSLGGLGLDLPGRRHALRAARGFPSPGLLLRVSPWLEAASLSRNMNRQRAGGSS